MVILSGWSLFWPPDKLFFHVVSSVHVANHTEVWQKCSERVDSFRENMDIYFSVWFLCCALEQIHFHVNIQV